MDAVELSQDLVQMGHRLCIEQQDYLIQLFSDDLKETLLHLMMHS